MIELDRPWRRLAGVVARLGVAGSATMLALSVWAMTTTSVSTAATNSGSVEVIVPADGRANAGAPLASGGSATEFSLKPPTGAACTGDSANDQYLWQTFMVPAAADPATLTFDANGPSPQGTGASFRQPFYDVASSAVVHQLTAPASPAPGPGPIVNVPVLSLKVYDPGHIPAGTYNIGIACTKGPESPTQVDRYWTAQLAVTTNSADLPAGIAWTFSQSTGTTTTTTAGSGTTTTTAGSGTTTTTQPTISSTSPQSTSPSTSAATGAGGSGPGSGSTTSSGRLPQTGGSTVPLAVWASLLLLFGRMAVLLGRTPAVRAARPSR